MLKIICGDITKIKVDAIVNVANTSLLCSGGLNRKIHRAAGPELLAECKTLGGCKPGNAKVSGSGKLPCKFVIHAVAPRWFGGEYGEREMLISCYRTSLELANEKKIATVAFPLISTGIYRYPKQDAIKIAVDTISDFLRENEMTVYIVVFDARTMEICKASFSEYIEE